MFGIKNSATPYVRTGGVDRQTVLTSNANGNAPVREIGVNANGNLVFSVDGENFKNVLDLKYSEFIADDENQGDVWETEKSVSMKASGTLEDGTTKETGVIVSQEYSAMVSASMKDDTSSASQISVTSDNVSIYSSDGSNAGYLNVTPNGVQVVGKLELPNSTIQEDGNTKVDEWTNSTGVKMHTKSTTHENAILAGTGGVGVVSADLSGTSTVPIVTTMGIIGDTTTLQSRNGDTIRTIKVTPTSTTIDGNEIAVVKDIPTTLSQLQNDSNFVTSAVDNLTNYYLKKDTYTKDEVNTLIGSLKSVVFKIVDTLPTTGETNIIYLVPHSHGSQDTYDEYIYINDAWEKIGSTDIDLSGYAKTTDLDAYLPLSGGQLTGALKIADGYDKGIQDSEGNSLFYMDDYVLYIRNKGYDDIWLGGNNGGEIEIGGSRLYSDINVVGRSFTYNDKSVAVKSDIPKTLNGKTLVANGDTTIYGTDITLASDNVGNLTDAIINANVRIDGKADTSAIPTKTSQLTNDSGYINKDVSDLTNYLPLSGGNLTGSLGIKSGDGTLISHLNDDGTTDYGVTYKNDAFEFGNYGKAVRLMGNAIRPKYETVTMEEGGVDIALLSDVPSVSQSTGSSTTATMSQDAITTALSGKVGTATANTFTAKQTFNAGATVNGGLSLANDTAITNASGNNVISNQTGGNTVVGNTSGTTTIQGSSARPLYTPNGGSTTTLALYTDTTNKLSSTDILQATGSNTDKVMSQNAVTTALNGKINTSGTTGGNTSGGLVLTAGHLYRIYVSMGSAQLSCLVKMPSTMVEQYWFLGMNLYGHYCRLHISSAGVVTYQYANVGNTNWTDNYSVYIQYEDYN